MPSLSKISDTESLLHRYTRKVVVYVEGETDVKLFQKIVGPGYGEFIQFQVPPELGTGSGPAKACVQKYRRDNPRVFALLDGEAAAPEVDGFEQLVKTSATVFALTSDPGVIYLADHEAENILIRQADIVTYITEQGNLHDMDTRKAEEVDLALRALVVRQLEGAICKYTSYKLHAAGKISGVLASCYYDDVSDEETLARLKARVLKGKCDWDIFHDELQQIRQHVRDHMDSLDADAQKDAEKRLADGKSLMSKIQAVFNIKDTWQSPLVKQVAASSYADRFRSELFALTEIRLPA